MISVALCLAALLFIGYCVVCGIGLVAAVAEENPKLVLYGIGIIAAVAYFMFV